jgi:hypothetical protein
MVTPNWLVTLKCIYNLPLIIASCKSFHACQKANWHIAVIEEDGDFLILAHT